MYSTKLKKNRITVSCIANSKDVSVLPLVFDTGAKYTVVSANHLRGDLDKNFLSKNGIKLTGFIKDKETIVYKYKVKQFTIGTVDLGEQDIYVVFGDDTTDDVLGFDILQKLSFYFNSNDKKMYIFKTFQEMQKYMISDDVIKDTASAFRDAYNRGRFS